ncbi:MAG: TatD family hydrolase [Spirochaetota bacterium]|nr:TatD family hydrolase [Spirochaetota bacterium]
MFIDTHAHLDYVLQNLSTDQQIIDFNFLFDSNLELIVHISLDADEFLQNYPKLSSHNNIYFATGIYPNRANILNFNEDQEIEKLKKVLINYKHVALGEIGIDFKDDSYGTPIAQESLFEKQLALAEELQLPVIIHSRMSFKESYHSLMKYKTPAIIHCFSYGIKEAELVLDRGDYISFSGLLTYKKSVELQEVAQMIPLDRILFETDSPYLSPVPVRHKSNIPNHVQHTYQFFANLRNIPIEELSLIVKNNFHKAFKI